MHITRNVVLALVLAGTQSAAQSPGQVDRRLSTTFGLSKGAGALTCSFCTGEGKGGFAGMLGVESTWRRGVRLGLELDWWMHRSAGASRSVAAAAGVVHLYPAPGGPFFLKVGMGLGRFSIGSDEEELYATSRIGTVGLGYDIRVSGRTMVVPYVSRLSGGGGTMRLNGEVVTPRSGLSLLQYGIAVSRR
jgi:hypothetical protein